MIAPHLSSCGLAQKWALPHARNSDRSTRRCALCSQQRVVPFWLCFPVRVPLWSDVVLAEDFQVCLELGTMPFRTKGVSLRAPDKEPAYLIAVLQLEGGLSP